jgi:hypothetical protein
MTCTRCHAPATITMNNDEAICEACYKRVREVVEQITYQINNKENEKN